MVKAKVDDADGIKAINLQNKDLYLNKTIDILRIYGDTVKTYNLEYGITAPDSLKTEAFPILITVEDLVGNVSAVTFNANMDGDFTDPKFTQEPGEVINVIMSAFNFKFAVSDNRVIQRVTVPTSISTRTSPTTPRPTSTRRPSPSATKTATTRV